MTDINWQQRLEIRNRPDKNPFIHQDWQNILFMHFKIDPEIIQKTLPKGLFVDTYDRKAYLSLVAFFMNDVRLCRLTMFPGLCNFIEVNVRTYVHDDNGNTGVWFYSLDLNSLFGAKVARAGYSLPYIYTHLQGQHLADGYEIKGRRRGENVHMHFSYEPATTDYAVVNPNSLDFFLIERYLLFTKRRGNVYIGQVHHEPYQVSPAKVLAYRSNLLESHGFENAEPIDLYHYTPGVSVDIFNLRRI